MDPATWGFIGALFGTMIGASASILTTLINTRNQLKLQSKIDQNKKLERFRDFQSDNLLRIQDKLSDHMRSITKGYIEDLNNFKISNKWGNNFLNNSLNEEIRISNRDLAILIERVSNDNLRNELKSLSKNMDDVFFAKTKDQAEDILKNNAYAFDELMTKVGSELRNNYTLN